LIRTFTELPFAGLVTTTDEEPIGKVRDAAVKVLGVVVLAAGGWLPSLRNMGALRILQQV
jgi:hypothetical protein